MKHSQSEEYAKLICEGGSITLAPASANLSFMADVAETGTTLRAERRARTSVEPAVRT